VQSQYKVVELQQSGPVLTLHSWPSPSENDVIIRPLIVGICRSDIKEVQGMRTHRSDFGHELVGETEWPGKLAQFKVGDIVCLNPNIVLSRTSGFAELMIIKGDLKTLSKAIIKVSSDVPLGRNVFVEPLSCAQHCMSLLHSYLNTSNIRGVRIGILGAGMTGTLIGLISKYLGGKISIFNQSLGKIQFLKERKIFSRNELRLFTNPLWDYFDVIIPSTTFIFPNILDLAVRMIRSKGLILLFGGTREGDLFPDINLDINQIRHEELIQTVQVNHKTINLGGVYGASYHDFNIAIEYLQKFPDQFPVEKLVNEIISLEQLPSILRQKAASAYNEVGKILVRI
jgi:threonine dehydrogenase-like Zn-dependent dehydrogenase